MDDLEAAAWAELHAANASLGWYVGRPSPRHGGQVTIYAFDPKEIVQVGHRRREWTAVAETELEVVREMARCLREISAGRVPK